MQISPINYIYICNFYQVTHDNCPQASNQMQSTCRPLSVQAAHTLVTGHCERVLRAASALKRRLVGCMCPAESRTTCMWLIPELSQDAWSFRSPMTSSLVRKVTKAPIQKTNPQTNPSDISVREERSRKEMHSHLVGQSILRLKMHVVKRSWN